MKKLLLTLTLGLFSGFACATTYNFEMKIDHYNTEDPFLSHNCSSQLQSQISYDIEKAPISVTINGNYNVQSFIGSFQAENIINANKMIVNTTLHPLGVSTAYDFASFNYQVITINSNQYILAGVVFDIANKKSPENTWGNFGKLSFLLLDNMTKGACAISSTPSPGPIVN